MRNHKPNSITWLQNRKLLVLEIHVDPRNPYVQLEAVFSKPCVTSPYMHQHTLTDTHTHTQEIVEMHLHVYTTWMV